MNARLTALDIMSGVLKEGSYLNLVLKRTLSPAMSAEDRRFITALVSTTIENLQRIDFVIDSFVRAKRVHTVIRNILRLGVCQLLFFESVPESAAVNESVKLAQAKGKGQLKGFVNATLRSVAQNLGNLEYPKAEEDFSEYLRVMYSYPKWLCDKYIAEYGQRQAEAMLAYRGDNSLTCVRLSGEKNEPPEGAVRGRYCGDAYYIKNASDIENMPMFKRGELTVMGEASMICVLAAGIGEYDSVLDLCAAPGGKSCYAARFASGGSVTAQDVHEHRVELIRATAARLRAENVTARVWDATVFQPEQSECFDVVLADVPCTALGLLHRKPDIKISKREEDIAALTYLQREILQNAARYVKPGGILLYSTCTIDRAENEDMAAWFLAEHTDFVPDELKNYLPEALMPRAEGATLQLLPHIDGVDGFFMARFRKNG